MDEVFDIDPSGKVKVVKGGHLMLPAACAMCGVGSYDVEKLFLDLGIDIEDYGIVYLCMDCGVEIGRAAGGVSGKIYKQQLKENEALAAENAEAKTMLERLGEGLERDILAYLSSRNIDVPNVRGADSSSEDVNGPSDGNDADEPEQSGESDSDTADGVNEQPDDNAVDDEPVVIAGPDDVSEPASNDPPNPYSAKLDL